MWFLYLTLLIFCTYLFSVKKKKKDKTWYLIFDGHICEINLNSATLATLAVQLPAGENPNLSSARCVCCKQLFPLYCASHRLSGRLWLQESHVGFLLYFCAVFQPPTPSFGFAHTERALAGGGKAGWQAEADSSVGVCPRVALTLGAGGERGGGWWRSGAGRAGHRPQPGQTLTHLSQQWLFIGLSPKLRRPGEGAGSPRYENRSQEGHPGRDPPGYSAPPVPQGAPGNRDLHLAKCHRGF